MSDSRRRVLGRTALEVSVLGFGSAPIGNLYTSVTDDDATGAVDAALRAGVRLFDTAPLYGHGLSERRLGRALAGHPRGQLVISTKVGRRLRTATDAVDGGLFADVPPAEPYFDYSYDGVMRSFEESLERLGLERIDLLLIHDADDRDRFRAVMEGGYRALESLRAAGVVGAIGAGLNDTASCLRFVEAADLDCFLLAGRYTLLEQESLDELLPLCEGRGIGVILGGPFNTGVLATGAIDGATYDYAPAPARILERVSRIEAVCREHGVPLPAAALRFPLGHPAIASVIPGARSAAEMERNAALMRSPVPGALWDRLKAERLIREDAPVP